MSTWRRRHKENAAKRVFRLATMKRKVKGCRTCRDFGIRFCKTHFREVAVGRED